jgi:hypothetical protein
MHASHLKFISIFLHKDPPTSLSLQIDNHNSQLAKIYLVPHLLDMMFNLPLNCLLIFPQQRTGLSTSYYNNNVFKRP